jgi:hypothetical protein
MKKRIQTGLLVAGMVLSGGAVLAQQQPVDLGKIEFESSCASCHGIDGKGNGPLANLLQRRPPDLTLLTKNNQGVFPINRLYEVIDGRGVPSHGTRDMPVWGRTYQVEQAQLLREARGLYDSPAAVRARILLLLEYISRIQTRLAALGAQAQADKLFGVSWALKGNGPCDGGCLGHFDPVGSVLALGQQHGQPERAQETTKPWRMKTSIAVASLGFSVVGLSVQSVGSQGRPP